jgi:hypothetical protein
MPAPGRYDLTARGPLIVGSLDGGQHPRALKFRDTVEKAFPVKISRHMRSALWSKLTVTASLTSLGAISGMNFGDMLKNRKIRELTLTTGREVVSAARASGIEFTASDDALNVNLLTGERFPPGWIKHLIIRSIGYKHRRTDSAMLASLELGRPTEIDFINGAIVRAAESAGIDTPVNRTIVRIVRELESGSLLPGKESMDRLFKKRSFSLFVIIYALPPTVVALASTAAYRQYEMFALTVQGKNYNAAPVTSLKRTQVIPRLITGRFNIFSHFEIENHRTSCSGANSHLTGSNAGRHTVSAVRITSRSDNRGVSNTSGIFP